MSPTALTPVQLKTMRILQRTIDATGVAPSLEELNLMLGLSIKSKSTTHRVLKSLEEKGWIERLPGRARAVKLTRRVPDTGSTATALRLARQFVEDERDRRGGRDALYPIKASEVLAAIDAVLERVP